jgi:RluA family pseudouridine synthase
MVVTNIAAYRFAALDALKELRERLLVQCREWELKGTILLSTEGINLFVAGTRANVEQLLALLRTVPGLEQLDAKYSESATQPFAKMLVKIKKEIIAFGVSGIDPVHDPAPRLSPRELKQWLDEGRPVQLLDTRNDYEVHVGTFRGAIHAAIPHFRAFPAASATLPKQPGIPVVAFCTGGIRCEKAAPFLRQQGFGEVYQLDGGILKYFEECGSAHFDGECFVFDQRVGLAADLEESGHGICANCQRVLTPSERADPRTVVGVSCPHCERPPQDWHAANLAQHRERLRTATTPLPGAVPCDNYRPLKIRASHAGLTMAEYLERTLGRVAPIDWRTRLHNGDVVDAQHQPVHAAQRVHPGELYFTRERQQVEPAVNANIDLLYEDTAIIVVHKPAPLPMHPSGRFNRNTLQAILATVYAPQKPRPAHRLDANTSGVAIFSRTATYAQVLQPQFERGAVRKTYLARVHGHPPHEVFACHAPIAGTTGPVGSRVIDTAGLPAHTDFRVRQRDPDGTTLLEVTPRTGRTNQIRVHLWHLGYPIVGDPMYRPNGELGDMQTLPPDEAPLCLHAWRIAFAHPQDGQAVTFEAPPPPWAGL